MTSGADGSGLKWRKSPLSSDRNCVEIAFSGGGVRVRDSKDPDGAHLSFTGGEWHAFVAWVRAGHFDVED